MAKAKNPFTYGGRVTGDAFCDRQKELKELLSDIKARQHLILFSQRRFGKTSLVWKLLAEARKNGVIPVYVDLYPVSSLAEFIELYAKAIAKALSGYEKTTKLLKGLFSRLYLSMGLDRMGNPQWNVGFDRSRETESLDEVLLTFEAHLKKTKKAGVVVFDEFQQITETNGMKVEARLRSAIQTHEHVSYIFVGSRKHLMQDIFSSPNRPFYRIGKIFPLGKISPDDFSLFIRERFGSAKTAITDKALNAVLDVTETHPYYIQYLCHILYDIVEENRVREDDVPKALDLLISREATAYMNIWDLLTLRQRQALVSLAETTAGQSPFRPEILQRFGMSQPAVMMRALNSLVEKDLVDKGNGRYEIIDVFFKRWIGTYISQTWRQP
jgi:AAA+ ATPase superfamily predicted ATPase